VIDLTVQLSKSNSLRTQNIQKALQSVDELAYVFETWKEMGTGTAAENLAAKEMRERILDASINAGSVYEF
jgi:hypothetical protein